MGGVGLNLIRTLHPAKGIGGPEVEPVDIVAEAHVEAVGGARLDNKVGEEVFGFGVCTCRTVGVVVAVVHLVSIGVE